MENMTQSVTHVLEKYPEARDDDIQLFYWYLKEFRMTALYKEVGTLLRNYGIMKLPKIETLTRLRRMVQRQRPDLQPKEKVARKRKHLEQKVREEMRNAEKNQMQREHV